MEQEETLWEKILSREERQIRQAVCGLSPQEVRRVLQHLQAMLSEEGWHPEQQRSAQAALDVLQPSNRKESKP